MALITLRGCAGCSAPLLFANPKDRFSRLEAHIVIAKYALINFIINPIKVSKGAKIRNRYNQVPHLTQYTFGKVTNSQLDTTNESQEVSPYILEKRIL